MGFHTRRHVRSYRAEWSFLVAFLIALGIYAFVEFLTRVA